MVFAHIDDDDAPKQIPSADEVRTEIEEWKRRVAELYGLIVSWLPQGEGYEADTSRFVPVNETMQKIHGIPPYELPLLEIHRDGKRLLRFWADARWVMLTRGRVTVFIGDRSASLLAKKADADGAEWKLYDRSSWTHGGYALTPELLVSLLQEAR